MVPYLFSSSSEGIGKDQKIYPDIMRRLEQSLRHIGRCHRSDIMHGVKVLSLRRVRHI
jgi:hypothetical protein